MSDGAGLPWGIRVVDLSRALAGPYATLMLADAGAEAMKVERPGAGDDTRGWRPPFVGLPGAEQSTYFLSINRNKRSVTLDFKDPGDLGTLRRLIARADVLAENFRPGVMEKLGLGEAQLEQLNPRLVVLSITGFGDGGPEDVVRHPTLGELRLPGTPLAYSRTGRRQPAAPPLLGEHNREVPGELDRDSAEAR